MTLTGQVKNGVVVLEAGKSLPEGTRVRVEALDGSAAKASLADSLLEWAGKGTSLPEDLAHNHDHYLHGQPKK